MREANSVVATRLTSEDILVRSRSNAKFVEEGLPNAGTLRRTRLCTARRSLISAGLRTASRTSVSLGT